MFTHYPILVGSLVRQQVNCLSPTLPHHIQLILFISCFSAFYLTTRTYLRIPLVLNFFACSEHIHALSQITLQNVLDAIMFEPGAWHPPKEKKIPASILI